MIRVVAFDLDDTLWHVDPVIIRAEQRLAEWLSTTLPGIRYERELAVQIRQDLVSADPGLAHRLTDLRQAVITQVIIRHQVDPVEASRLATAAMEKFLAWRNEVDFFEGVLETIESLAADYQLGAITNGNANIRQTGLDRHFSFAFSAEEVGAPKPEPDLFHHALAHTGCEPQEMVYVGDDPVKDVDAANRVGLRTIWLRNDRRPGPAETTPDLIIDRIGELPDALEKLRR